MNSSLTKLPNIGRAIAKDLISIGIKDAVDLKLRSPLSVFIELKTVMGHRHDPCVYYTLLSVKHFNDTGEVKPWWYFTAQGKEDLKFLRSDRWNLDTQ